MHHTAWVQPLTRAKDLVGRKIFSPFDGYLGIPSLYLCSASSLQISVPLFWKSARFSPVPRAASRYYRPTWNIREGCFHLNVPCQKQNFWPRVLSMYRQGTSDSLCQLSRRQRVHLLWCNPSLRPDCILGLLLDFDSKSKCIILKLIWRRWAMPANVASESTRLLLISTPSLLLKLVLPWRTQWFLSVETTKKLWRYYHICTTFSVIRYRRYRSLRLRKNPCHVHVYCLWVGVSILCYVPYIYWNVFFTWLGTMRRT